MRGPGQAKAAPVPLLASLSLREAAPPAAWPTYLLRAEPPSWHSADARLLLLLLLLLLVCRCRLHP